MSDDVTDATGGDSFTEVTSQSWFGRIKDAIIGLVFGLVLVPGMVVLLAWNEGRAVDTLRALNEGSGAVVDVGAGKLDPANQGRLVHLAGPLAVGGTLNDPDYGVAVPGAAKLVRHVDMYQWEQTESHDTHTKLGGGSETVTTYRYNKVWSGTVHDSSRFRQPGGHANPAFRLRGGSKVAAQGQVGGFRLDAAVLGKLAADETVPGTATPSGARLVDGVAYVGADPQNPAIGDMRISWTVAHPASISVVGQQVNDGVGPYATTNGQTLLMVDPGTVSAAAMFNEAKQTNSIITWAVRVVGASVMLGGFYLLLRPFAVVASVLPLFGDILAAGAGLVALLLTAVVAPVTIAVAWLAFRPVVGGLVLAGGLVIVGLAVAAIRGRRGVRAVYPPPRPA